MIIIVISWIIISIYTLDYNVKQFSTFKLNNKNLGVENLGDNNIHEISEELDNFSILVDDITLKLGNKKRLNIKSLLVMERITLILKKYWKNYTEILSMKYKMKQ